CVEGRIMATRIPGSAGTEPQGAVLEPPSQPRGRGGPGGGVLVMRGDRAFVDVNGELIPVDVSSLQRALGGAAFTRVRRRRSGARPELVEAITAVERYRRALERLPGVVDVRAGYKFDRDGRITKTPAIVLAVTRDFDPKRLPEIKDAAIDVAPADPYDLMRKEQGGAATEAFAKFPSERLLIEDVQRPDDEAEEVARVITYRPPAGASLPRVVQPMTVTCHVSPDAGWSVLRPFLTGTREEFVLGMYDFTAPHIYDTVRGTLLDSPV